MSLGDNLRNLRELKGLTQKQMSEILDISKSNISKYESNDVEPNIEILKQYANYFNVSIDVMLGLKEPRTDLKDYRNDFSEDDDKSSEKETLTLEEKTVLRHFHKDPENVMLLLESFENLGKRERIIIVGKCLELEKSESVAAEQPLKAAK